MFIQQRLYYNVYTFIFKILNNTLSKCLRNKLKIGNENENKRQIENIAIKFRRTRCGQKSMFYEEIKMYNASPYIK